jgi:hypothetical protein
VTAPVGGIYFLPELVQLAGGHRGDSGPKAAFRQRLRWRGVGGGEGEGERRRGYNSGRRSGGGGTILEEDFRLLSRNGP